MLGWRTRSEVEKRVYLEPGMDDLDREIEEAARLARRKVWSGRLATIASTATLLIVGTVGCIVVFTVFPEPKVTSRRIGTR